MSAPSTQLLAQLNTLKADPEIYAGERGGLVDDTATLALHEGFEELAEMLREAEDEDDIEDALKAWPVDLAIHMTYTTDHWSDHGFYEPASDQQAHRRRDLPLSDFRTSCWQLRYQPPVCLRGRYYSIADEAKFNRLDEAVDYMTRWGVFYSYNQPMRYSLSRRIPAAFSYDTVDDHFDNDGVTTRYTFHVEGIEEDVLELHRGLRKAGSLLS